MNIKTEDSSHKDLDSIIEMICSPDAEVDVEKIAIDENSLPEFLNLKDISDEEKENLKLLSRSIKLSKIIERIHKTQPSWAEKASCLRGITSQ